MIFYRMLKNTKLKYFNNFSVRYLVVLAVKNNVPTYLTVILNI